MKSTTSANNILEVNNLKVRFGSLTVLNDISFVIARGEFVGVIGPNGAGKSTLFKTLLGLVPFQSGKYQFTPDITVGYVPQQYTLPSQVPVSVAEVVRMGAKKHVSQKNVLNVLSQVGLDYAMANKNFHNLSGGQKQRVIIARALIASPDMILFDEPLSGVDMQTKQQIYDLLKTLNQKGMTILFVSHDVNYVIDICDRILCLDGMLHKGCHPANFVHGLHSGNNAQHEVTSECLADDNIPCTKKLPIHHHHS